MSSKRRTARQAAVYSFTVASDAHFESSQALYLTNALVALGMVALQIVARQDGIRWRVVELLPRVTTLDSLRGSKTSVRRESLHPAPNRSYPFFRGKTYYTSAASAAHPLLYVTDLRPESDPLLQLAHVLSFLKPTEEVRYTVLVTEPRRPLIYRGLQMLNTLSDVIDGSQYPRTFEMVIEHKQHQPWYATYVMVDVDSPNRSRIVSLLQAVNVRLTSGFDRHFANHPFNGLRVLRSPRILRITSELADGRSSELGWFASEASQAQQAKRLRQHCLYLEAAEIAALWHLPHKAFEDSNVIWHKERPNLPLPLVNNSDGVVLGKGIHQDAWTSARLLEHDRETHTNIIGHTGVGKSTLLHQMIHQDIAAGKGLAVIDPHSSLVESILRCSIPQEREKNVVVLDLHQTDYPIPLNIFASHQSYAGVGRIVDAIEQLYSTGVRMDKYMRAGIRALQDTPHSTMKDLARLLIDEHFRYEVLQGLRDEESFHTLHDEYHIIGENQQRTIRMPILSRISPFYANDYLEPVLCHPECIDFTSLIDTGKIVLIALNVNSEQVPGKERNLVGSLFISLLQMVGMNPYRKPKPYYVYIDEVQNFVNSSLDVIFSEARKYGLFMTVANQFFGQLPSETQQAVMGNVGTTIAFRSNVPDAQALDPYMQPQFNVSSMVSLDKYQAAVKMQYRGETQDAFLLRLDQPIRQPADGEERERRIRQLSIEQYTPRTQVQIRAWLAERYPIHGRFVQPPKTPKDNAAAAVQADDFSE